MHKDVFAAAARRAVRAGMAATAIAEPPDETITPDPPAPDDAPDAPAPDPPAPDAPADDEPGQDSQEEGEQDLSATDSADGATGRRAVTHNKHDVDAVDRECAALVKAIELRDGRQVDVPALIARVEGHTAIRLLVERGICTEAEAQGEVLLDLRNTLRGIFQQVEVERLRRQQQQAGQVQAVRQPGLIVPASHTMRRERHQD